MRGHAAATVTWLDPQDEPPAGAPASPLGLPQEPTGADRSQPPPGPEQHLVDVREGHGHPDRLLAVLGDAHQVRIPEPAPLPAAGLGFLLGEGAQAPVVGEGGVDDLQEPPLLLVGVAWVGRAEAVVGLRRPGHGDQVLGWLGGGVQPPGVQVLDRRASGLLQQRPVVGRVVGHQHRWRGGVAVDQQPGFVQEGEGRRPQHLGAAVLGQPGLGGVEQGRGGGGVLLALEEPKEPGGVRGAGLGVEAVVAVVEVGRDPAHRAAVLSDRK